MGTKVRQSTTPVPGESPRSEIGEIDTRAPFSSVKAAVSLFGEVAISSDRSSAVKKTKSPQSERVLAKETELHLAQMELKKYKEQLQNAEATRAQALTELEKAKNTVDELTHRLNEINKSKELAIKATEEAKSKTAELESSGTITDTSLKKDLDSAREHYVAALADLDAAKQELRKLKKDFETSLEAKLAAVQQETDAKQLSETNTERASQLSQEITAAQESLSHVKAATEQAQLEEVKIRAEKDAARQKYKERLEETKQKIEELKKDSDPAATSESLEGKLSETNAEIEAVQKKIEEARAADLASLTTVNNELDEAKEMLLKVSEEEATVRSLVESLKLELEAVKKEHEELKHKDAETEAVIGDLHLKLQKCKAELEAAAAAESKATASSDELLHALEQLSSESKTSLQEAEVMKKTAEELKVEAEAARVALAEAEKKLEEALKDAEEAKASETTALNRIKELSERTHAARASTSSESGGAPAKITISKEEFDSLSRKVEEAEKLSEMKVAAAMAQVEAVRASENEAIKRLETARKEMEEIEVATEEALKRAEMAEAAKKAVEGELKRWREKEQKRTAEAAARILAESQQVAPPAPPAPPAPLVGASTPWPRPAGATENNHQHHHKKKFQTAITSIFHKKKGHSHADASSASYLPGERRP